MTALRLLVCLVAGAAIGLGGTLAALAARPHDFAGRRRVGRLGLALIAVGVAVAAVMFSLIAGPDRPTLPMPPPAAGTTAGR